MPSLRARHLRHEPDDRRGEVPRISFLSRSARTIPINHRDCSDGVEAVHEHRAAGIRLSCSAALVNAEDLVLAVLVVDCCCVVGAS